VADEITDFEKWRVEGKNNHENTKSKKHKILFFVVSIFRDFVMKVFSLQFSRIGKYK